MSEELRLHRCCFTGHRPDKMELGEKEIKPLLEKAIDDAIAEGYVCLLYPDKPRHPRQRYLLTVKGMTLYNELKKGK